MIARIAIAALLFATVGCAPRGEFPSLAKRPIEASFDKPPVAPRAPDLVSDPAALARVKTALDAARASVPPFDAALTDSRPAVAAAAGAPETSERWIEGQIAASRIEPLLDRAAIARADIEEELRVAMTTNSADRLAIEAALAEASKIVESQAQAARALTDRLDR